MKDVNKIILIGRLGADPVRRETKKGIAVVNFPLATTRRVRRDADDENGSVEEETQWHRIVVWNRQAEVCAQYLKKGDPVYVEGEVRSHRYQDKEGVNRTSFEVHSERVGFLGKSRRPDGPTEVNEEAELPLAANA